MHPSSAPWLHAGVCWVGWGDGWAPCAAEESSSCMGTHGWTWYHQLHSPSSSAQSTNAAARLSRCAFRTSEQFCCLPLAPFPQALQQLGMPPRNTRFAQTSSRGGTHGRRGSQLFLFSCLWLAQFGNGLHQAPVLPVGCCNSCLPRQGLDQSAQKKECVCVCVQVEPGLTAGHFPAGVGLDAALGPSAASHLAGAAGASCRAAQPPPERSCSCTLAGQRSQKLRFHCKHLHKREVGTGNGKDR